MLFFEDPFHLISIFRCKSNLDPLTPKFGKKYSITFWAFAVFGKPGFEIPGTVDSPFTVPYGRFFNFYPFNVSESYDFFSSKREIVMVKNDFIFGY